MELEGLSVATEAVLQDLQRQVRLPRAGRPGEHHKPPVREQIGNLRFAQSWHEAGMIGPADLLRFGSKLLDRLLTVLLEVEPQKGQHHLPVPLGIKLFGRNEETVKDLPVTFEDRLIGIRELIGNTGGNIHVDTDGILL